MSLPHPAAGAVVITDDIDEGLACFKIVTESATYFYDKAGAGFTSILDRDGIDWINFHPEGAPGVPDGQSGLVSRHSQYGAGRLWPSRLHRGSEHDGRPQRRAAARCHGALEQGWLAGDLGVLPELCHD